MDRGNKPVPQNVDPREGLELTQDANGALVPYQFEGTATHNGVPKQLEDAARDLAQYKLGRQMVYGELEFGSFDEEISGINLSKLFSVYGPQSAEGKRKKPSSKLGPLRAAA